MTPQQHKQHLLALAERANILVAISGLNKEQHEVLDGLRAAVLEYAARLTPGVSESAQAEILDAFNEAIAWGATYGSVIPRHQWNEMRSSKAQLFKERVEAVFPFVDDGQAKDAARYRWLRTEGTRVGHNIAVSVTFNIGYDWIQHYDFGAFDAAIDAAMAAPPKDEHHEP